VPGTQQEPGRVGGGEQAGCVGVAFTGCGEHAEQLDAVAGVHPVAATVPLHGGLADQVLGCSELTPVLEYQLGGTAAVANGLAGFFARQPISEPH
jgi:hypothetical protein